MGVGFGFWAMTSDLRHGWAAELRLHPRVSLHITQWPWDRASTMSRMLLRRARCPLLPMLIPVTPWLSSMQDPGGIILPISRTRALGVCGSCGDAGAGTGGL